MNTLDKSYRHEIKFLISKQSAELLKYKLSLFMKKDHHYDDYYNIRSLYFDDLYNSAYYEKIDGIMEREKYRIRIYNLDKNFISLELKGKDNDLTYKKRDLITLEEYNYIINKEYEKITVNDRKVLNDFIYKSKMENLIPSIIVDYNRLAFVYDVEDIRVTFDEEIKSGIHNHNLFDNNIYLEKVLEEEMLVLEVKYNNILPKFIKDIIDNTNMIRISLSKFTICMEKKGI